MHRLKQIPPSGKVQKKKILASFDSSPALASPALAVNSEPDPPVEQPPEQLVEQVAEQPVQQPVQQPVEQPVNQSFDQSFDRAESTQAESHQDRITQDRITSDSALEAPLNQLPEADTDFPVEPESDRPITESGFTELYTESELYTEYTEADLLDNNLLTTLEEWVGDATPPMEASRPETERGWYLGLDIGTTGISAVLLDRNNCQLYPIRWSSAAASTHDWAPAEPSLRLPTTVYLATYLATAGHSTHSSPAIAPLTRDRVAIAPSGGTLDEAPGLLLQNFKPYLRVGIPHYSPQTGQWEPVLQWSEQYQVPLSWMHQALRSLLTTLNASVPASPNTATLRCDAVGLDQPTLYRALRQLEGVIVGYPSNWSDTYSFNLREVVLSARLVAHPEHIHFVEDSIAVLLAGLRNPNGQAVKLPAELAEPSWFNSDWRGGTFILNAGAAVTELALVDIPEQLSNLSHRDFTMRSVLYGGNAIEQDIVCQLLVPALVNPSASSNAVHSDAGHAYTFGSVGVKGAGQFVDGWNWQPSETDVQRSPLADLELHNLTLPSPGDPDPLNRHYLQHRLEGSPLGQNLLEAARHLKLTLQHQDRFTVKLGAQQCVITRPELASRVFLPYIQRLNRELNNLLSKTGFSVLSVNQVICTGGTASLSAIARWLHQKFPNATILQDADTEHPALAPQENSLSGCSRVAYGLATVPLHAQVLDTTRHQYSDYFLLLELLRMFPHHPVTVNEVMQILERRGINTQACYLHILALLEGHLPPGLVPTEQDAGLMTPDSRQNPDYQALLIAPLFYKQPDQTYRPNRQQWNHLRRYLDTVLASTHQKLTEPLALNILSVQ